MLVSELSNLWVPTSAPPHAGLLDGLIPAKVGAHKVKEEFKGFTLPVSLRIPI
jgi:hypothetical protein